MKTNKKNEISQRFRYKGNEVSIDGTECNPIIFINDESIKVEVLNVEESLYTSPLTYKYYSSPMKLTKGMIDIEFALKGKTLGFITAELRRRRDVGHLMPRERMKFRDAVLHLKESGVYEKYVQIHKYVRNFSNSGPAFLPWNRVFLYAFEQELQRIDNEVSIPYWDSTSNNLDNQDNSLIWRNDFFGKNGTFTLEWEGEGGSRQTWEVRRNNFNMISIPVDKNSFNLDRYNYTEFCQTIENTIHAASHVFLGVPEGDQTHFETAVNDPFFFLIQCNIDRLWMKWQQDMKNKWLTSNVGMKYPPTQLAADYYWDKSDHDHTWKIPRDRHNLDDIMWPWDGTKAIEADPESEFGPWKDGMKETYTPRMMLNHHDWGYFYDEEDLSEE